MISDLTEGGGPVWAAKARTPAETQRTAPIARGGRSLALFAEECLQKGERVPWVHEGSYRPGTESIWISFTNWDTEYRVLFRFEDGTWKVNPRIYDSLKMPTSASNWLATLL